MSNNDWKKYLCEADEQGESDGTWRQSQGPSWGWSMSGLRTSAIAGIGVNWRPLGFTVAGEQASAEEQGEEVTRPRLKGLEGGPGRTKTALSAR